MKKVNEYSRRQFVKIGAGAAGVALLTGLAGCAGGTQQAEEKKDEGEAGSETMEAQATTQTITDHGGDAVEVPLEINAICDLWHAHNQVILMLGAGDKLVGTTENFKKRAWANVVYPRLAEVEALVVGQGAGEVNYEETLNLEPDVVFASSAEVIDGCRQRGLTALNVMFQDYDGLRSNVALTGQVLGGDAQARAEQWAKVLDENIALVADRMKGVSDDNKKKVLHIVNSSSFTKVDGTNCIVDEWIKLAGGVNALQIEGNMIEVSMEEIVAANPDVIILGAGGSNVAEAIDTLLADPAWSGITAVQNEAVYANPSGVFAWDRYSGEEALQVLWAAKFFNPDLFADIDMVAKTKEFYATFYGYDLTDDEANRMLAGEDPA